LTPDWSLKTPRNPTEAAIQVGPSFFGIRNIVMNIHWLPQTALV
jgi:hypothetical protein